MRLLPVIVVAFWAGACTTSGGRRGSGTTGLSKEEAAAEALTRALQFNNQGASMINGEFPGDTSGVYSSGQIELAPGGQSSVSIQADTDVAATLVWMSGSESFWTLPATGATREGDKLTNTFTVSPEVCADLCNIIHQVKCYEAVQTSDGTITQANLTTVQLQCEAAGSVNNCSSFGGTRIAAPVDAGGSSTGSDGSSGGEQPGTCEAACANLQNLCPAHYNTSCVSECASREMTTSCLSCCASVTFPAGKCADEGVGEVGIEDCDDDGVCPEACN